MVSTSRSSFLNIKLTRFIRIYLSQDLHALLRVNLANRVTGTVHKMMTVIGLSRGHMAIRSWIRVGFN